MDEPNSAPRDDSDAAASEDAGAHSSGSEQTPPDHPPAKSDDEETSEPPEPVPRTIDEIFAEMVAGLSTPSTDDTEPGVSTPPEGAPAQDQGSAGAAAAAEPSNDADDTDGTWSFPTAPWVQSGPRDRVVSPEVAELEELEDRFIPPEPDMVLGRDPLVNLAWGVVITVPLGIIASMLFWPSAPAIVLQIAGLGFLASFGALVWRMPASRDPDERDPGAVV